MNSSLKPEERVADTMAKLRGDFESLLEKYPELAEEGFTLHVEVKSAYKDSSREEFIDLYEHYLFDDISSVRDILENKPTQREKYLYVAKFDRLSRVFLYGLTFQLLRKLRGIHIYTLNEKELDFELENKGILECENMRQTMFIFQLMMLSSSAAQESEDMSMRIKKRVKKSNGVTLSSKSEKRWGAPQTINQKMRSRIRDRSKRFTAAEIQQQSDIYQIRDGKKKPISIHTITKIIQNPI